MVRLRFIRTELDGGHSICTHGLSYASQEILVFNDEKKLKYITPLLYLHMYSNATAIRIIDMDKITKELRSICNESKQIVHYTLICVLRLCKKRNDLLFTIGSSYENHLISSFED